MIIQIDEIIDMNVVYNNALNSVIQISRIMNLEKDLEWKRKVEKNEQKNRAQAWLEAEKIVQNERDIRWWEKLPDNEKACWIIDENGQLIENPENPHDQYLASWDLAIWYDKYIYSQKRKRRKMTEEEKEKRQIRKKDDLRWSRFKAKRERVIESLLEENPEMSYVDAFNAADKSVKY